MLAGSKRLLCAVLLGIVGATSIGIDCVAAGSSQDEETTGDILVILDEELSPFEQAELLGGIEATHDLGVVRSYEDLSFFVLRPNRVEADEELASAVAKVPGVRSASLNHLLQPMTNDEMYAHQWYLRNIGQQYFTGDCPVPELSCDGQSYTKIQQEPFYDIGWEPVSSRYTGSGIRVGVIDSGVDQTNPDLAGVVIDAVNTASSSASTNDWNGHGTLVTSLIAARANNGIGIAGVAPDSRIHFRKNEWPDGTITVEATYLALRQLRSLGVDVINISQGGPAIMATYQDEIQQTVNAGILVVASAGNLGDKCWKNSSGSCVTAINPTLYPAAYPGVVSVGAVDSNGTHTVFSTFNPAVTVAAPGKYVLGLHTSTPDYLGQLSSQNACDPTSASSRNLFIWEDGQTDCFAPYVIWDGTSFSAPIVAGAAALMRQKYGPRLTSEWFNQALQMTSVHPSASQGARDDHYGYGRLNLERLLSYNFSPVVSSARVQLSQASIPNDGSGSTEITAQFVNLEGAADMTSVSADFSAVGLSAAVALNLVTDDQGILTYTSPAVTVPQSVAAGTYPITVRVADQSGFSGALPSVVLTVTQAGTTPSTPPSSTPSTPPSSDPGIQPPVITPVVGTTTVVSVTITGPNDGDGFATRRDDVTLKGEVSPDVATLVVDGTEQTIQPGETTWTAKVDLDEGENEVEAVAWDLARAQSARASITITLDTEAPDDVENLRATGEGAKTKLAWDKPDDDVEGYHVYVVSNDEIEEIGVTRSRSFLADGVGPFAVTAEDEAGNESDPEDAEVVRGGRETGFSDVPPTHFASLAVATLRERGIVQGYGSAYVPDGLLTRAEFAKMLVGVRGLAPGDALTGFSDVSRRSPLAGYVGAVVAQEWARGQSGRFYPNRSITRMEAGSMIVRALGVASSGNAGYSDVAPGEEMGVAAALKRAGVASGQNGLFMPNRVLTRAEGAKMLAGLLSIQ